MTETADSARAVPPDAGPALGEGNAASRLARRILRWGHPRSPVRRTVILTLMVLLWLVLGAVGWSTWEGRNGISADGAADYPYLTFWLLTPQGDVAGDMPLALNMARYVGAAIPLLGILFLAARQIGDAVSLTLTQLGGADHLVIIGEGLEAVSAAEAAHGEGAAVVVIDPTVTEAQAEDLNQLGVLVIRDDLRSSVKKAALARARRVVVVGDVPTVTLSLARRAAESMDANEAYLHVQIEDADIIEMMRQTASAHSGPGPAIRPFSLAESAARRAHEELRLWDRSDGLHLAVLNPGAFSEAMARRALSLGWRIGRAPPRVTLWDPAGDLQDRWTRIAPGAVGDLSQIYDSPPFQIEFSQAASVSAFLAEVGSAAAWVVEDDVGDACAAALAASRLQPAPMVVVSGPQALDGMLPGVHMAVSGFAAGLEQAILPTIDRLAQQLHRAYAARAQQGYILPGSDESRMRWSILPESLWSANRAAAAHIAVKLADADEAGRDPRDDREFLMIMSEIEHERWCAERLLNGWCPGERDNTLKLHPGLIGWSSLDDPTKDKDSDGVIDAFLVARPRPSSQD